MPLIRQALAVAAVLVIAGAARAQDAQHLECAGPFAQDASAETLASVFGAANVVGGYVVTDRMLQMFRRREPAKAPAEAASATAAAGTAEGK